MTASPSSASLAGIDVLDADGSPVSLDTLRGHFTVLQVLRYYG